jgi:hypothetical protein
MKSFHLLIVLVLLAILNNCYARPKHMPRFRIDTNKDDEAEQTIEQQVENQEVEDQEVEQEANEVIKGNKKSEKTNKHKKGTQQQSNMNPMQKAMMQQQMMQQAMMQQAMMQQMQQSMMGQLAQKQAVGGAYNPMSAGMMAGASSSLLGLGNSGLMGAASLMNGGANANSYGSLMGMGYNPMGIATYKGLKNMMTGKGMGMGMMGNPMYNQFSAY